MTIKELKKIVAAMDLLGVQSYDCPKQLAIKTQKQFQSYLETKCIISTVAGGFLTIHLPYSGWDPLNRRAFLERGRIIMRLIYTTLLIVSMYLTFKAYQFLSQATLDTVYEVHHDYNTLPDEIE